MTTPDMTWAEYCARTKEQNRLMPAPTMARAARPLRSIEWPIQTIAAQMQADLYATCLVKRPQAGTREPRAAAASRLFAALYGKTQADLYATRLVKRPRAAAKSRLLAALYGKN